MSSSHEFQPVVPDPVVQEVSDRVFAYIQPEHGLPRGLGRRHRDLEVAPPFVTFSDRLTLWVDDLRCEVIHVGEPAHTTNDTVVWIPERSVLFCGDLLFNGGRPLTCRA